LDAIIYAIMSGSDVFRNGFICKNVGKVQKGACGFHSTKGALGLIVQQIRHQYRACVVVGVAAAGL
nr:hypothetical protein [Tanacetum cinerariifolium]